MDVSEFKKAATLAEEMSRSRHKQIRLILTPRGVSIDGKLFRPDGVVMQRYAAEQKWDDVDGGATALEALIHGVDRKLVAYWSNAGPAEEP